MKQQEKKEQAKQAQEFDFIKEKIKDKPVNKRRLLARAGWNLLGAVVFGVVACFVFVLLKPYFEEWMYPEKESTISIPKDDVPEEEAPEEPAETPTPVPEEPEA